MMMRHANQLSDWCASPCFPLVVLLFGRACVGE